MLPITLLWIDIAKRIVCAFCYIVLKTETSRSTLTIAIQLYFIRLFLAHQMAMIILSTAYEVFTRHIDARITKT